MINASTSQMQRKEATQTEHSNMHDEFSFSITGWMRSSAVFSKITSLVTTFFFLSTFYFIPAAHAADEAIEAEQAKKIYHPKGNTSEEKLANTLQAIKEKVAERKEVIEERLQEENTLLQMFLNMIGFSGLLAEDLDLLLSMTEQAELLQTEAADSFAVIEQQLKAKKLPEEILQRHYDAVNKFEQQYQQFKNKLTVVKQAESLQDQGEAMEALNSFISKQKFKRSQKPFDPNNMPYGTPDPKKTRKPATDAAALNKIVGINNEPSHIQQIVDGVITQAYAQAGNQPAPADLESTIDVQVTDAIIQQAADLNNNPVEIYNWVRNNIDYMPTYGSIQGSHATLESKKGNAFDTASLLIALLRASNVPARYAYGTVRMPIEEVMNWVGGAEVPEAALSVLGQGGIPNLGRTQGGKLVAVELEHVWVEAWVEFEASRGTKNVPGNSWVPMDASFKQFEYTDGVDIQQQVPLQAQVFADSVISSAIVDELNGSIQNIDQQTIQNQLGQHRTQVDQFINSQPQNITIGEVIGSKAIKKFTTQALSAGLPYEVNSHSQNFASLTDNLRHKYRVDIGSYYSRTFNLSELGGKSLALSFKPATEIDKETLRSLMPNDPTQIDQLPRSIPGYLVTLEARLAVDHEEIPTGALFQMGNEVAIRQALYDPAKGWAQTSSPVVAGEYHAISVSVAGVSSVQASKTKTKAQEVRGLLEECHVNSNCSVFDNFNQHLLLGLLMDSGVLSWFSITEVQSLVASNQQKVIYQPLPSYGKFGTVSKVQYSWGVPRSIGFVGVQMDIDYKKILAESKEASNETRVNFVKADGFRGSANEHLIPEQLFTTSSNSLLGQGVSSVKALSSAIFQGQRIFILNQSNIDSLNNISVDSNVRNEIRNAIFAGSEVTVHEDPVSISGWVGTGYIIHDPNTGSGAYKISGGANGGFLVFLLILVFLFAFILAIHIGGFAGLMLALWEGFTFLAWADAVRNAETESDFNTATAGAFLTSILGLMSFGGVAIANITKWFGVIFAEILTNPFGWFY